jgi:Fe-S cluster assembly protein SufD
MDIPMSSSPSNAIAMKTKAERSYAEQFEAVLPHLPGGAKARKARRAAMARFADLGLPHRRIEEWKYTDLRSALKEALPPAAPATSVVTAKMLKAALGPLASIDCARMVFVDGRFSAALTKLDAAPGVLITNLAAAQNGQDVAKSAADSDAVVALNHAFASDGAVITIAAGSAPLGRPLMLVFLSTAAEAATVTTRNLIDLGADVAASIIEVHAQIGKAAVHSNTSVELEIGDRAVVDHVKVVLDAASGVHLSHWDVNVGANAIYRPAHFTPSCGLARNEVSVQLMGGGSKFDFAGIALGRNSDHIDTTMVINHIAPGCQSRELFKTVLDGNARVVFQGKVVVAKEAQKTDGKQMAKALMLSPNAEFDSKPELEIYADDVACGHGSTCAEIDPDLIFYCRSRGIPEAQARALLLESFVGEAIEKIDHPHLRRAVSELALAWLTHRPA